MTTRKINSFRMEADIHGMTAAEAKKALEKMISSAPAGVKEIDVIHGYTGGTALQRMVRNELKHKRITGKLLSLNPGVTTLAIKDSGDKK